MQSTFNLINSIFLSYPGTLVLPLAILLLLGMIGFLMLSFRRGKFSGGGVLRAIGVNLVGRLLIGTLLLFMGRLIFAGNYNFVLWNNWTSNSLKLLGLALVAVGLTVAFYRLITKKLSCDSLVCGGLSLWLVLTIAISFIAPGGSYLFALPLLFSLVTAFLWFRNNPSENVVMGLLVFLVLSAAVAILLWVPALALIGVGLGSRIVPLMGIIVFLLLTSVMAPHLAVMNPHRQRWIFPVAAIVLGAIVILAVGFGSGYSSENPKMNSIIYTLDTETGEACWLSFDRAPDAWTSQFLGENPARETTPGFLGSFPALRRSASKAPLNGVEVKILGEETSPDVRKLRVKINWPFKVHRALIFLSSPGEIRKVLIDGQKIGISNTAASFTYNAPPPEGIHFNIELAGGDPLNIEAVGQIFSLPELKDFSYRPRPVHMMALGAGSPIRHLSEA